MHRLPGKFVWFEHISNDIPAARAFYDPLFHWHTESPPSGPQRFPTIMNGSHGIGAYRDALDAPRPYWLACLSVVDVDTAFDAALDAGACAIQAPADGPCGRAATLADPGGAVFGLRVGNHADRPDISPVPAGDWYWNELWTGDDMRALVFYQQAFGYTHDSLDLGTHGTYFILCKDGVARAGLMRSAEPRAPSMWLPYVTVHDCDATALHAHRLGGEVLSGPRNSPGLGRFAVLVDPVGAAVAIMEPSPAAARAVDAAISEATAA
jgi:predicted enzyme related to lactoylglutathione lyase